MKGDWLVFMGREDDNDDMLLYSVDLAATEAEPIELDDDVDEFGRFTNVRFSENGRSILYSVWEDGFEDVQIRQVPVNGEEDPERLYDDVELIDVRWDGRADFQRIR